MIAVNEGQYLQEEEEDWLGGSVDGWLEVKYCGYSIVGIVGTWWVEVKYCDK